jgi:hypothetical protein
MKKILFIALLFAACRPANHDGFYFNHGEGEYSVTDDTVEIQGDRIFDHVGFQRKRHGKLLPKEFKTQELFDVHPRFEKNYLIFKTDKYYKIN